MTLNAKIGVFINFWAISGCETHFSRANCAESNYWYRHGKAAYEVCSIERRFRRSMSQFSRF